MTAIEIVVSLLSVIVVLLVAANIILLVLVQRVRTSDWARISREMSKNLNFVVERFDTMSKEMKTYLKELIMDHESRMHGVSRGPEFGEGGDDAS